MGNATPVDNGWPIVPASFAFCLRYGIFRPESSAGLFAFQHLAVESGSVKQVGGVVSSGAQ